MPFSESAHSLKARAGLSHIPTPVFAGSVVLALFAFIGIGIGFASFLDKTSALTVESQAQERPLEVSQEGQDAAASEEPVSSGGEGSQGGAMQPVFIKVHVAGAVANPGVYEVDPEGRVQDAVDAAGGLSSNAAPHAVNLAQKLTDGQQVYIPTKKEAAQGDASAAGSASSGVSDSASASAASSLVNINTASEEELDTLPGVGPATAQAIISYRQENGPFAAPEDIQNVSGIGQKKYQDMEGLICV